MEFNEDARAWLRANVANHVPNGTRQYFTNVITTNIGVNSLGLQVDRPAFEGKVIHCEPGVFGVVKTGRNRFVLVDAAVLAADLEVGSKVHVTPYQRRRFDGKSFLEPIEEKTLAGGVMVKTYHIGDRVSEIPLPAPQCEYLQAMQDLLHRGNCTDGIRVISNMLVDFNAKNLAWQQAGKSAEGELLDPQFRFDCETSKFTGHVRIGLDRSEDAYYVEMHKIGMQGEHELVNSCKSVFFVDLAEVLETLLCDGQWKLCKVTVLKAAKSPAAQEEKTS